MISNYADLRWEFLDFKKTDLARHARFQRLWGIAQLGLLARLTNIANHTRWVHSIDALHIGIQSLDSMLGGRWDVQDYFNDSGEFHKGFDTGLALMFLPFHDIGHYAGGHAAEYEMIARGFPNHKQRGAELIISDKSGEWGISPLRDLIESRNVSPEELAKLYIDEQRPESAVCSHPIFGADKVAYLIRDSYATGFKVSLPDHKQLFSRLIFNNGDLGLQLKRVEGEKSSLELASMMEIGRVNMYVDVYFSPFKAVMDRVTARGVGAALDAETISPEFIGKTTDYWLFKALREGEFMKNTGNSLAALKIEGHEEFVSYYNLCMDKMKEPVYTVSELFASRFSQFASNTLRLTELEDRMRERVGYDVLVATVPDPKKLEPGQIMFYDGDIPAGHLLKEDNEYQGRLQEMVNSRYYIRLYGPYNKVGDANKIHDVFMEEASEML